MPENAYGAVSREVLDSRARIDLSRGRVPYSNRASQDAPGKTEQDGAHRAVVVILLLERLGDGIVAEQREMGGERERIGQPRRFR